MTEAEERRYADLKANLAAQHRMIAEEAAEKAAAHAEQIAYLKRQQYTSPLQQSATEEELAELRRRIDEVQLAPVKPDVKNAPEPEIEITPEMIQAGLVAYGSHDEMFESRDSIVEHIYRAMAGARKLGSSAAAEEQD